MTRRIAPWIAFPIGVLNCVLAMLSLLLAWGNGMSLWDILGELTGPLLGISFSAVGSLIVAHRPRNPLGWIYLAVGCSQAFVSFANQYAQYALITTPGALPFADAMSVPGELAWVPGLSLMLTYGLLLFPDGRLLSPRWRWVAWLSSVPLLIWVAACIVIWPYRGRAFFESPDWVPLNSGLNVVFSAMFPLLLLCGLASVVSLIVRFWRSRGIERQQLKWFTFAAAFTFTTLLVTEMIRRDVLELLEVLLGPVVAPAIPVATGIAILRYRLYDIDVIIRRTLIYSTLTALLVLIYLGSIVVLQALLRPLVGTETELATVASTLAIAALFNPLRRRIQAIIDRRFYRRKYDAAKTLQAFSLRMRDEVDLDQLQMDLIAAVDHTLQPAHVSLWLREGGLQSAEQRSEAS